MAYKKTDEIFVKTLYMGYIPHLKTSGPIANFIKVDVGTCYSMILSGIELYQFDPVSQLTVKLTVTNLYDDKKFEKLSGEKVEVDQMQKTDTQTEKEDKKNIKNIELNGVTATAVTEKVEVDQMQKTDTQTEKEDKKNIKNIELKAADDVKEEAVATTNDTQNTSKEGSKPTTSSNKHKNNKSSNK